MRRYALIGIAVVVATAGCTTRAAVNRSHATPSAAGTSSAPSPASMDAVYVVHPRDAACSGDVLRLGSERVSEATQQHTRDLRLTNVSHAPCHLYGYVRITLFFPSHRAMPFGYAHRGDQMLTGRRPRLVDLAPGRSAWVGINQTGCANYNGTPPAASIAVTVPAGGRALRADTSAWIGFYYCGPHDPGSTVDVTPFVARELDLSAHP